MIILSDLFDDLEQLEYGLKHLRYNKMDVSLLHIIDPAEQDFPFQDPTLFKGLESHLEQMTDPRTLCKAYRKEFADYLHRIGTMCRTMNIDYQLLRTDQSLEVAISSFLTHRLQHVKR